MIFSKTVTASELRDKLREFLLKITGRNVLQIIHRGQPIRVVMTQDYYLSMLGKIAAFESSAGQKTVPHKTADEIGQQVAAVADRLLGNEDRQSRKKSASILATWSRRARTDAG